MAVTLQTTTLDISSSSNAVIEDYVFADITGDALRIGASVSNLTIRNCAFYNISENGVYLRVSGDSTNVIIENCTFQNLGKNAVLSAENHIGLIIRNNVINNVALDPEGSAPIAPHHGIYLQCPDFLIEYNVIDGIVNENGNCISVRSYGIVRYNTLLNATKYAVSYFSDHAGSGGDLVITQNKTYVDNKIGINVLSDGTPANHVDSISITENYIYHRLQAKVGVDTELSSITTTNLNRNNFANVFDTTTEPYNKLSAIRDFISAKIAGIVKEDGNFFTWNSESVNPTYENINIIIESLAEDFEASHPIAIVYHDGLTGVSPTADSGRNGGFQTLDANFKISFYPFVNDEIGESLSNNHDDEINKCIRDLEKCLLADRTLGGLVCNLFYNGANRYEAKQNTFGRYVGVFDINVRYRQFSNDVDRIL